MCDRLAERAQGFGVKNANQVPGVIKIQWAVHRAEQVPPIL